LGWGGEDDVLPASFRERVRGDCMAPEVELFMIARLGIVEEDGKDSE
jgi:hypothetical protein